MGVVWLAERADGALKRTVALKLPYAGPRQKQLVERFLREKDILVGLTHKKYRAFIQCWVSRKRPAFSGNEIYRGLADQ